VHDLFLHFAAPPSPLPIPVGVDEIKTVIDVRTRIGQALVASIGTLAFICALACMP